MPSVDQFDHDGTKPAITRDFVLYWSDRYQVRPLETDVLDVVGPAVAKRGYYNRSDLRQVVLWKSPRSTTYIERNSDSDIEDLTRMALAAPERLRHRILCLLDGVGVPIASALLMACEPSAFTVTDFRAIETLRAHGELSQQPNYMSYLQVCTDLAKRANTDLRTLDRALWQWSKEQGKAAPGSRD
ncbi:hypothetical protein ACGFIW_21115 [Micromonospora sp. NPDC048935]|uniref:hypothetical protein n=1 Tax=Micromonospora sp. NPDC048935 TaxID=3364262 RepID=UPI00372311A7